MAGVIVRAQGRPNGSVPGQCGGDIADLGQPRPIGQSQESRRGTGQYRGVGQIPERGKAAQHRGIARLRSALQIGDQQCPRPTAVLAVLVAIDRAEQATA